MATEHDSHKTALSRSNTGCASFAKGVAGLELSDAMRAQAERFGSRIELGEVSTITTENNLKKLATTEGARPTGRLR